mgnify:CR=1 FL=1
MGNIEFWALIVGVATATGSLIVAVFIMGRFTGRLERGIKALDCKLDEVKTASKEAHEELRGDVRDLRQDLSAHLQASIPQTAIGD